jgi:hypothetical protein
VTTKADRMRYDCFRHIGCIVSRLYLDRYELYDVHHLVEGYRLGNQYTIPLNPWFHRGVTVDNCSQADMERIYGPSLAKNKRAFVDTFGTERQLLEKVNAMVDSIMEAKTLGVA